MHEKLKELLVFKGVKGRKQTETQAEVLTKHNRKEESAKRMHYYCRFFSRKEGNLDEYYSITRVPSNIRRFGGCRHIKNRLQNVVEGQLKKERMQTWTTTPQTVSGGQRERGWDAGKLDRSRIMTNRKCQQAYSYLNKIQFCDAIWRGRRRTRGSCCVDGISG